MYLVKKEKEKNYSEHSWFQINKVIKLNIHYLEANKFYKRDWKHCPTNSDNLMCAQFSQDIFVKVEQEKE